MMSEKDKRSSGGLFDSMLDMFEAVLLAVLVVVLCTTFLFRLSRVSGISMEDSFFDKDILVVFSAFYEPERNDVIVAYSTVLDEDVVKRVIGVGGDIVVIDYNNGTVSVDGDVLDEDYIKYGALDDVGGFDGSFYDVSSGKYVYEVPEGSVFVLGDNRNHSADSRSIGFIDEKDIKGKVVFRLWSERAKAGKTG